MSKPIETVQRFIEAFIAAWPTGDASSLGTFFTEDAVYHNIPLEPVQGRHAIEATLAGFMALGGRVDVEIPHLLADSRTVMMERVDHFIRPDGTVSLPVMGIFEIRDGQIVAWRDYFDPNQFSSAVR